MEDNDQCLNSPITEAEILKCITKLKNSKAPGTDHILNEYMKYTNVQMISVYTRLFNLILDTGLIPTQWVEGMIKPIYKNKGDSTKPENYRPITLLSCLGKLFTSVINERLNIFWQTIIYCQKIKRGSEKNTLQMITFSFYTHYLNYLSYKRKNYTAHLWTFPKLSIVSGE